MREYYDANKDKPPNHGENWKRVLIAFNDLQDDSLTPYTAAEASQGEQRWSGWKPVREALECIEGASVQPPAIPEISISGGAAVTEGGDVVFTISASPVPAANLDVSVSIAQSGDFGVSAGTQTVTIPTTGSVTLTVSTTGDSVDEADGSVSATLASGAGYTVSSTASSATINVQDDDVTSEVSISGGAAVTEGSDAVFTISASPAPAADLDVDVSIAQSGDFGVTAGTQTVTIPTSGSVTLTVSTTGDSVDEADGAVTATLASGTGYTVSSTAGSASIDVQDDDATSEVSISGGANVTEGGLVTLTISASPAPGADLDVSVSVSQSGDFGVVTGTHTVTIPSAGSAIMTVSTTDDSVDEADGSVTVTLVSGSGYTVSSTAGSVSFDVLDDDAATTPEISISGGAAVTEGSDAVFTISASPAPAADLAVDVSVSQSGDFGVSTGTQTVTVPSAGSVTLTVSTTGDSDDEADGAVTATVASGSGYTVSSTAGSATIDVQDDDAAPVNPYASLIQTLQTYQAETQHGEAHVERWTRALAALGHGSHANPMTLAEAQQMASQYNASRWQPLVDALTQIEAQSGQSQDTETPADPVVSVSGGAAITEGGDAVFTISASPAPAADLAVDVSIAQTGDFGVTAGTQTVTIPSTGSVTLTVSTTDDTVDEADGSVTATLASGSGYTVSSTAGKASIDIQDDDAVTISEISISGGAHIAEGADAIFTLSASPAPASDLDVTVSVTQSGDWGITTGTHTVTIPSSGRALLNLTSDDDSRDEVHGSVSAALESGSGYTISSSAGSATIAVRDNDATPQNRSPRTDITWADFWAPYADLIDEISDHRNHPVLKDFRSHTDIWDRVLLALGRDVEEQSLSAITASEALRLADQGHEKFDRIAPALDAIDVNGPPPVNPGQPPQESQNFPSKIAVPSANSHTIDLGDYFSDPEGATLSYTAAISGVTVSASVSGDDLTLALTPGNSRGGGTLDIKVSDGQLSIDVSSEVVFGCGNSSWDERFGSCVAASSHNSYSGGAEGDNVIYLDSNSQPAKHENHTAMLLRYEGGGSGKIRVRIHPSLIDAGGTVQSGCRLRGHLTVVDGGGGTLQGTWAVRTTGNGFTANPLAATNRAGSADVSGTGHPGWNDASCSNAAIVANGYRLAIIDYTLPADDNMPGTANLPATVKLVYTDLGSSGTQSQGTYDLVNIKIKDSISTITTAGGIGSSAPIREGTGQTGNIVINSDDRLVGYLTFRDQDYLDNGPATRYLNYRLTGGAPWVWQGRNACFFNKVDSTNDLDHGNDSESATCKLEYVFANNGYVQAQETVELWWVELAYYGYNAPEKYRTLVTTLTLNEAPSAGNRPAPVGGNYWIEWIGTDGNTVSGNRFKFEEGGTARGYIVTGTDPSKRRVAVEVRSGNSESDMLSHAWLPLNRQVSRYGITNDGLPNRPLKLVGFYDAKRGKDVEPKTVGCNLVGYFDSCFGAQGPAGSIVALWQRVGSHWKTPFGIQSIDDDYVDEKERWYQFRVKDSTSGTQPRLGIVEDDGILILLEPDLALNGKLDIEVTRAAYRNYSFRLHPRGSTDGITGWDQWDVAINANWKGTESSYALGDSTAESGSHTPDSCTSGAGFVRAEFENYKAIAEDISFYPSPQPGDPACKAGAVCSGWVQVCK